MDKNYITNFIDFLQDNFKTELYRNDAKAIITKLVSMTHPDLGIMTHRDLEIMCQKHNLPVTIIENRLFLYTFFLTQLGVNVLPYLDESSSYNYKSFKTSFVRTSVSTFITEFLTELKTFIVPGDRKVIESDFLIDTNSIIPSTKLFIEEGVETIQFEAFSGLKKLKEIYLPASLKSFGDVTKCNNDIIIYYKPVSKSNGKKGVGFEIISARDDKEEWFKTHLKKY